jgi:hypothetical protein
MGRRAIVSAWRGHPRPAAAVRAWLDAARTAAPAALLP